MKKNMNENFEKLEGRIFDTLYTTDLEKINYELARINGPTLVSGVGGIQCCCSIYIKSSNAKKSYNSNS